MACYGTYHMQKRTHTQIHACLQGHTRTHMATTLSPKLAQTHAQIQIKLHVHTRKKNRYLKNQLSFELRQF